MKICYFGIYDPGYSRNRVLISGFKDDGHELVECRVDPKEYAGLAKYKALYKKAKELDRKSFDRVIVAFPGQSVVWFAVLLFGRKKVVFDAFVSLYDSNVEDRELYTKSSLKAWRDWFFDWYSVHLAPIVLLDTKEHIEYFAETFGIDRKKMIRVFVGTDTRIFYPREEKQKEIFLVHFHGSYIPLHGIEYIIDAAHLLEVDDVKIRLIGDGQVGKAMREKIEKKNIKNIELMNAMPAEELAEKMAEADVCLGIFGKTKKTQRVIPNKVFEALAMKKLIISADTLALRELLAPNLDMIAVPAGNALEIAEAVRRIKTDKEAAQKIAQAGFDILQARATPVVLVKGLVDELKTR